MKTTWENSQEFLGYFWTALKKDIDTFKLVQAATTKNVKQSERHYPKKQLRAVTSTLLLSFYVTVGIAEVSQYLVATKGFEKNNQQFVIALIEKDHLGDRSPEKDCCCWLTFRQPVLKPSSESSGSVSQLKIQKPWWAILCLWL